MVKRDPMWLIWIKSHTQEDLDNLFKKYIHVNNLMNAIGYAMRAYKEFYGFYDYCIKDLKMDLSWWNERKENPLIKSNPKWLRFIEKNTKEVILELWKKHIFPQSMMVELGYGDGNNTYSFRHYYEYCVKDLKMDLLWWEERRKKEHYQILIIAQKNNIEHKKKPHNELISMFRNTNEEYKDKRAKGRLLKCNILEYTAMEDKCKCCKRKRGSIFLDNDGNKIYNDEGKIIVIKLSIDHINGNSFDNLLLFDKNGIIIKTNLRFLCNICHANQPTTSNAFRFRNDAFSWREKTIIIDEEEVKYRESY